MAHAKISRTHKPNQQSEVKEDPLTLGQHIAAVLDHPDTPEKIYNGIVDGLNELQTRSPQQSSIRPGGDRRREP